MKTLYRSRDKGKTIPGQLIKGSSEPRLTAPSIPCKNKNQIEYKQPSKAFGITSQRFLKAESLQDSVGPGSYEVQKNPQNPSFSKKGFGSMLSQKSRDLSLKYNRGPGPADYSRTETSFFNKEAKRRAISFCQAENPGAFWSETKSKLDNPGPFQYKQMLQTRSSNISLASFKSSINRWRQKRVQPVPNPSTYTPNQFLVSRRSRGIIIQQSKPVSKQAIIDGLFGKERQRNGPGQYMKQKSQIKHIKSKSTSGFKFMNQSVANLNKIADIVPSGHYRQFLEGAVTARTQRKSKAGMGFAKMTF